MKKALAVLCLSLLPLPALAAHATPASSPTQVQGILDRVTVQVAARRDYYWHHGDYPRIIALDRIVTQAAPHFLECYETGGWLMESLGDLKSAEAYYRQGVANNPRTSESYFHLGMFYFNTKHDYARAVATFRQGTARPDADINDWKMLAHSYRHAQAYAQEVAAWQHIKSRWPNGVAVDHNLSEALAAQQAAQQGAPSGAARP